MISKNNKFWLYSNPNEVIKKANLYDDRLQIFLSSNPNKKYMIINPDTNKIIHFGHMGSEDYTKHNDIDRRRLYLKRATKIKGNWKENKFSPNNLSINLLW